MNSIPMSQVESILTQILEFPYSQVCIHLVALKLLSLMEEYGYDLSDDLIKAVVDANSEKALYLLYKRRNMSNISVEEAANLLNVSIEYVNKLIQDGFIKTLGNDSISKDVVLLYKAKRDKESNENLYNLSQLARDFGFYDK